MTGLWQRDPLRSTLNAALVSPNGNYGAVAGVAGENERHVAARDVDEESESDGNVDVDPRYNDGQTGDSDSVMSAPRTRRLTARPVVATRRSCG